MPHAVDQEVSMLLRPQYFQLQYSPEEQRTRTMEQAASKRKQDYRSAAFSWFSWEGNSIDKVVKGIVHQHQNHQYLAITR